MADYTSTGSITSTATFTFSTEDFTKCFSSPAGDLLNRNIYTTINHTSGEFLYEGRLSPQQHFRRCDIGIKVPDDSHVRFNVTNINLPCQYGRLMVYESSNKKTANRRMLYCDKTSDDTPPRSISVLSRSAVVTLTISRFSPDISVHVAFSAFPRSEKQPGDHRHRDRNVTDYRYHMTKPSQTAPTAESCCSTAGLEDNVNQ